MKTRKAFNFYRSFYDVYKELNDKQAKDFMDNLLAVEFLEKSIDEVVFKDKICSIVWNSIKHSIDSQIKGYSHKMGISLENDAPTVGGTVAPCQQGEGEGEEEGQLQLCTSNDAQSEVEHFEIIWKNHSESLKTKKTKSGNIRKNSNKEKTKEYFLKLLKKYSYESILAYVRNDTLKDYPKELLNLFGKSLDIGLLKILNTQDVNILNEALSSDDFNFLGFIEAVEEQI